MATVAYANDHRTCQPVKGTDGRHWFDYLSSYLETEKTGADGIERAHDIGNINHGKRRTTFRGCELARTSGADLQTQEWKSWGGYGMNVYVAKEAFAHPGPAPYATLNYEHAMSFPLVYKYAPPRMAMVTYASNRVLTADSASWALEPGNSHLVTAIDQLPKHSLDPILVDANGTTSTIADRHRGRKVVASFFDGRAAVVSFSKAYCGIVAPDQADKAP
jgi:hypothetical protein